MQSFFEGDDFVVITLVSNGMSVDHHILAATMIDGQTYVALVTVADHARLCAHDTGGGAHVLRV